MVGLKIHLYALYNTRELETSTIFSINLDEYYLGTWGIYLTHHLSPTDIDSARALYGITGRHLKAINFDGQETQALILADSYDRFTLSAWSNQNPSPAYPATLTVRLPANFMSGEQQVLDVSNALIEEEIETDFKLESNIKFDLEVSSITATIDAGYNNYGINVRSFFDTYWLTGRLGDFEPIFGIELLNNGTGEFWGYARIEDIIYDKLNDNYIISAYDWYNLVIDRIGDSFLPALATPDIENFIAVLFPVFSSISINVNGTQSFTQSDYRAREDLLKIKDFIIEMQKSYGAYIYYSGDKSINFINRNKSLLTTVDISNLLLEDNYEESFALRDYNRILLNVVGGWSKNSEGNWESYEGWAWVYENNGEIGVDIGVSQTDIDNATGFLDLRQELPEVSFDNVVFGAKEPEERYADYEDLLKLNKTLAATVDSVTINITDKVLLNGNEYKLDRVKKQYLNQTSIIEAHRLL